MCDVVAVHPLPYSRRPFIALFAIVIGALSPLSFAEEIRCRCKFAQPPWEAFGSRAACSTVTNTGKTSCNISFGGTGADPKLVSQVLGLDPKNYERQVNATLIKYLTAVDGDRKMLTDPAFINTALPMFMRGAYLREGVTENHKELDAAVASFTKTYSIQIAKALSGGPPLISKEFAAVFVVERGTVIVVYKGIQIVTIFLPAQ